MRIADEEILKNFQLKSLKIRDHLGESVVSLSIILKGGIL